MDMQERSRYWLRRGHFQTSHSWFTKLVKTGGKLIGLSKPMGTVSFNYQFFFQNSFQIQKIWKTVGKLFFGPVNRYFRPVNCQFLPGNRI